MADPRLKQIKIKTGIVRRIAKEKICYDNEANQQRARIQKMKDECKEEYAIRKQEEVLQESLMMVPDCQRRLEKAYEELKNILKDEKDLQDSDEYSLAKKALEEAQPLLPNPEFHSLTSYAPANMIKYIAYESECEEWSRQRINDEQFVNNFVKARIKPISRVKPLKMKIYEAKKYLTQIILMKKEIENGIEKIDANSGDFDVDFGDLTVKKNQINGLLNKFDGECVGSLRLALQKRKKKRMWQRKRKEERRTAVKERNEYIKMKHDLIDKLLGEKIEETESAKRKEALKRQADLVLHEVRRKKYEAKKTLNLLQALLKLRELRSQQEIAQGGYCSVQVTQTFTGVINHFENLWKKQMEKYDLEERGLKVMLEESDLPEMKVNALEKTLNQWEKAIFGIPNTDWNYNYLTRADSDINSLVTIRKEWDQFIADSPDPLSSRIPTGWVLPPEPGDSEWGAFVRSKKSNPPPRPPACNEH